MAVETAQEETPAPVTVAKGGRGSFGADVENFTRSAHRKFSNCAIRISEIVQPQQLHPTVPYIGLEHIAEGGLYLTGSSFAAEASSVKNTFKSGDILFGKLRPYFRKVVRPKFSGICSTDIWVIRAQTGIDQGYLFYLMASQDFIERSMGSSTGTRMPRADWSDLSNYLVDVPPLAEQKRIVSILGALDDKIELNRRMNAKLEDMARTLFKSWFVDFDPVRAKLEGRQPAGMDANTAALFPDAFEESALGLIPKGWEVLPVGDVVECVGGSTPSTAVPGYWEGGTHHWTTPKDFSSLQSPILLDTGRKITDTGLKQISSGLLPAGTLLMSSCAPVGYLAISVMPVAINQGFIPMKCNAKASNYFMLNWCQTNMSEIEGRATGTTFAEISKQNFRPILLLLPSMEVVASFTAIVEPLYEKITINRNQAQTLSNLRDSLL